MPTKIIRNLSIQEHGWLKSEVLRDALVWRKHSWPGDSALKDGKTIHVKTIDNYLKLLHDQFYMFQKTHEIVVTISGNRTIGRCYWHRLRPGDTIMEHTDSVLTFVEDGQLDTRYQIYLDCPDNLIVIDGVERNAKEFENSIVDFDLRMPHSYRNGGNTDWYFFVFDVMKPGVMLTA